MTSNVVAVLARLEVPLPELLKELKRIKRVVTSARAGQVVLSFRDGHLVLALAGAQVQVRATGRWPGEARAGAGWVGAFAKVPPVQDPVVFQVKEGRLHVATLSLSCDWQRINSAALELPLNANLIDTLRLALQHEEVTLEQSGLAGPVNDARSAAAACIDRAMQHLDVLGVSRTELESLVTRSLREPDKPA